MSFLDFELNDLPDDNGGDFEPIPAGWYTAKITKADVTPTKAGTGEYIKLQLDILGPSHQGRVVFANLNIKNPSPKTEEIGRSQLKSIMRSIGLAKIQDSDQLVGGTVNIKVAIKDDPEYGKGNEVKGYKAVDGSAPPKPAASNAAEPAPTNAPPWAK